MAEETKESFSIKIITGKRTYFFDVKEGKDGVKYLVISESKRLSENKYEHNRIIIFEENIPLFIDGLIKTLEFMKRNSKAYSIKEIRKKYPKAYTKWTKEEDASLRDEYLQGKTIDELAEKFQRKPSAIRSRLQKLGLLRES